MTDKAKDDKDQDKDIGSVSVFGGEKKVERIAERAEAKKALDDHGFGALKKLTGSLKTVSADDLEQVKEDKAS